MIPFFCALLVHSTTPSPQAPPSQQETEQLEEEDEEDLDIIVIPNDRFESI